jgi:hypothetical protein
MLHFINQSVLLMGKHVDFSLIVSSQVQNSCLFLVVFNGKLVDHLILIVQYLIKTIRLGLKGFSKLIQLLILENCLAISLSFDFLEFCTMCSFNSFDFFVFSVFFLIHLIFPLHFGMHKLFL